MLIPRWHHVAAALILCAQLGLGCGDDGAAPPGVSTNGPGDRDGDGGGGGANPPSARSPRPDGGAILPRADDEIELQFGGDPVRYPIVIEADPGVLDVHLSIDTSSSIAAEIDALQEDLESEVTPRLRARVASASFGVSRFEDFPAEPFGTPGGDSGVPPDTPYRLLSPITSDVARVASAVAGLDQPLGFGGDIPESGAEALWQIATGDGYSVGGRRLIEAFDGRAASGGGNVGGVGFRPGALRAVLHVTDAPSHDPSDYGTRFPDTHGMAEAAQALKQIDAKLLAIVSGACAATDDDCEGGSHAAARAELEAAALFTGAFATPDADGKCPYGLDGALRSAVGERCPLVFDVSDEGEGLAETLIDAIVELVDGVRFERVTGEAGDDPLGFVQRVVPAQAEQLGDGEPAAVADLLPEDAPDGEPDSFVNVRSKASLRFEVELRNTRIAPSDIEQRFRVVVQVSGDGLILEERTLRIRIRAGSSLVPPAHLDAATPDPPADDDAGT